MAPPPFSLTKPRYDMDTYWGRTKYWTSSINPIYLLENERTLQKSQMLLDRFKAGEAGSVSDAELWRAREAIEQCVHPTTQEAIFPLFRMCAFLPMNFFVVPFMMAPSTVVSAGRTLFIQWFNQSYNSAVNYANRSSDKQPMGEIAKGYTAAVVVACGCGLGATYLLKGVPAGTLKATMIRGTVPFAAVVAAAVVNLSFMRRNEWSSSGQGLQVTDEDGVVRGHSTAAGMDSLKKCSVTRVIWNLPSMVLPTMLMVPLTRRSPFMARNSAVCEGLLQIIGLTVGVPPALAAYNVNQTIPASKLEPRFQGLTRKDGSPVQTFGYYKGL